MSRKCPKTSWIVKSVSGDSPLPTCTYERLLSVMSPVGISRVNIFGKVIYGNPRWMEMSGRWGVEGDFLGESLLDYVHPDDRRTMNDVWRDALENIKKVAFELRWGTVDQFLWGMGELVPEIVNEEV